ncbi:MAG: glucose 1-dehydrogenase [Gammaproteobacteria bacterium]|nr:glucose 1-dehydrogenase [Gammaproteobacteria bacterium]
MKKPTVLITGALAGIGRATALAFANEGAQIVISGRREEVGEALVKELRALNVDAEFIRADVRREDEVKRLIDKTIKRFGRLDIAVNNAGTEGHPGPVTDQTAESFNEIFETNVLGVLLCMKYEMKAMQAQKSGSIINISSAYGKTGAAGASVYVASKHAVEGLTKCAALEGIPYGIRVNIVGPGPIETGMLNRFTGTAEGKASLVESVPMKRVGTPEEIANAIVFVGSDKASYMTGTSLGIDGGVLI